MPSFLALNAGLGALQAGSSIIGGISQSNLAKQQAGLYMGAAANEREQGGQNAAALENKYLGAVHSGIASAASGGVAPTAGSAGVLARANIQKTILGSTMERYGANLRASSDVAEAAISRYQAGQAMLGGFIGAGTSLLTAGLRQYQYQQNPGGTLGLSTI